MQKKIHSLLFIPCCLALCLALGFLMSCGDEGNDPVPAPTPPGPGPKPPVTCTDNCNTDILIINPSPNVAGDWKLTVDGRVELYVPEDNESYINSIYIAMYNKDIGGSVVIMDKKENFGKNYDFLNGQGEGFDFKPCNLNKYAQEIYIKVTLSDNSFKDTTLASFKDPHPDCSDYSLTTNVYPSPAAGTVSPASGSYPKGDVTLTATAANGYYFYNWTNSFGDYADSANPYIITIDNDRTFTANFVESRSLVKDQPVELRAGQAGVRLGGVDNAVSFVSGSFQAGNGVKLIEKFQSRNFKLNDPNSSKTINDDDIKTPTKTHDFIAAEGSEETSIELVQYQYFVAKTGPGWGDWFLLMGKKEGTCIPTGASPCIELTIWKVQ